VLKVGAHVDETGAGPQPCDSRAQPSLIILSAPHPAELTTARRAADSFAALGSCQRDVVATADAEANAGDRKCLVLQSRT
jgi:hypothetical protein